MSKNLTRPVGGHAGATDGESETGSDPDVLYRALSQHRRRATIRCLQDYGDSMTLADLADEIAVTEYETPLPEIDAEDVKEIYISLYHVHVPMLSEAGLVEYEQEADLVSLADRGREITI